MLPKSIDYHSIMKAVIKVSDAVIADAVTASQPQWTASVHIRWRAEVSRLIVPVVAPAASASQAGQPTARRDVLRDGWADAERLERCGQRTRDLLWSLVLDLPPLEHPHQLTISQQTN